jgi:hypothetical protein
MGIGRQRVNAEARKLVAVFVNSLNYIKRVLYTHGATELVPVLPL